MSELLTSHDVEALFTGLRPGSEEALYCQDQVRRFTTWRVALLSADSLDLAGPQGPANGPVLVLPGMNVPVAGWNRLRSHLGRFSGSPVKALVGSAINQNYSSLSPFDSWYPESRQELHNKKAFEHFEELRDARESNGVHACTASKFFEDNESWSPNAIDGVGRTLMFQAVDALASGDNVRAEDALTVMVERGGNINRPSLVKERSSVWKTPVEHLLDTHHPAPLTLDPEHPVSDRVWEIIQHASVDWALPRHRDALEHFFSRIRSDDNTMRREPEQGAVGLYQLWRQSELDLRLPAPRSTAFKPRF